MKSKTYSLGLIGYPLSQSLSPRLHDAAMQAMRLAGSYRLYSVPPLPEGEKLLCDLLQRLRKKELRGLNVTIPHKQAIIPYLDRLTRTARAIGAVNTVFLKDGRVIGENTDAPGFLSDLERILRITTIIGDVSLRSEEVHAFEKNAIILGAGGAARAVTYALLCTGWEVTVAARRLEQAKDLIDSMREIISNFRLKAPYLQTSVTIGSMHSVTLDKSSIINLKSRIVVNATPAGMWPEVNVSPWPKGVPFPTCVLVYDLVYNPADTMFTRSARLAGLTATNGLGMLIEQAALALEIWTGKPAPRQPMWETATEFLRLGHD